MANGEAVTPAPKKPPADTQSSPPTPNRPPWRERRRALVPAADDACSRRARRRAAARALSSAATRRWSRVLRSVWATFPVRHASVIAGSFDEGSLTRVFGYRPMASAAQSASPYGRRPARVTASSCVNGVNVYRPARTTSSNELATWAADPSGARASIVRPTAVWSVLVTVRSSFASRLTSADGPLDRRARRHGHDSARRTAEAGDFTGQCAEGGEIGSRGGSVGCAALAADSSAVEDFSVAAAPAAPQSPIRRKDATRRWWLRRRRFQCRRST